MRSPIRDILYSPIEARGTPQKRWWKNVRPRRWKQGLGRQTSGHGVASGLRNSHRLWSPAQSLQHSPSHYITVGGGHYRGITIPAPLRSSWELMGPSFFQWCSCWQGAHSPGNDAPPMTMQATLIKLKESPEKQTQNNKQKA